MADTESELKESTELKKLFALWQEKQKEDIDRNLKNVELDKRQLKKLKCTLRDMGISSHFVELLDQEQDCLLINSAEMKDRWKNVLKNAFNMDGCMPGFKMPKDGYEYIFLFKEANDSAKKSMNYDTYPIFNQEYLDKGNVNPWIAGWKDNKSRSGISNKLPKALALYSESLKDSQKVKNNFLKYAAYMNVNKRGGNSCTNHSDQKALLNYARYYREYILREIEILTGPQKQVKIFVCGSKTYFDELIKCLRPEENLKGEKFCFIHINHPSYRRISAEKLAEQMKNSAERK